MQTNTPDWLVAAETIGLFLNAKQDLKTGCRPAKTRFDQTVSLPNTTSIFANSVLRPQTPNAGSRLKTPIFGCFLGTSSVFHL